MLIGTSPSLMGPKPGPVGFAHQLLHHVGIGQMPCERSRWTRDCSRVRWWGGDRSAVAEAWESASASRQSGAMLEACPLTSDPGLVDLA